VPNISDPSTRQLPSTPLEGPLTPRVTRGFAWVLSARGIAWAVKLLKMVVFAWLLLPRDLGLFGYVLLTVGALTACTQTGFDMALVQRKEGTEQFLDTGWAVQAIRGCVLALLLILVAPGVAWFFGEPQVVPLLRVMALGVAVEGFVNIGIIYFQKELQFHRQFLYLVGAELVGLGVGVPLAYVLRSAWALVWGSVSVAASHCVLSYLLHPYRPGARFDRAKAAELFRFGRWLLGSSVVVFLASYGGHAFAGKLLGTALLGFYEMAYRLSDMAICEIAHVANAVMMPAYAKVQDDRERLGRGFLNAVEAVMALVMPLTLFIVVAAPDLVIVVLSAKWSASIVPIQILAVAGCIRALTATGGILFVAVGRPRLAFLTNVIAVALMFACMYPLTEALGLPGTSLSVAIGLSAGIAVWARAPALAGVTWPELLARFRAPLLLAGMVGLGVCLGKALAPANLQLAVLCEVAGAALCGAAGLYLADRFMGNRLYSRLMASLVRGGAAGEGAAHGEGSTS